MAKETRKKINLIPGLKSVDDKYFIDKHSFDYDETKIVVKVSDLGISGFDVYKELFDSIILRCELVETHLVLAVLSIGTSQYDLDALVEALKKGI